MVALGRERTFGDESTHGPSSRQTAMDDPSRIGIGNPTRCCIEEGRIVDVRGGNRV